MVHVITASNAHLYTAELDACFRLRHDIFVRERKWNALQKSDNRERDQFDTPHAIHFAVIGDGDVVGYARMLPTLRPHLLSDVYPQLVEGGRIPRGPDIYEWTRHCVARRCRGRSPLNQVESQLILGIFEYCVANGIGRVSGQGSPAWISRMLALGLDLSPLGLPQEMEGQSVVAMIGRVTPRTLAFARRVLKHPDSVLEDRSLEDFGEVPGIHVPVCG